MKNSPPSRRTFLSLAGGALAWTAAGAPFARSAERPPNFVFVLVDDLGWADLGCYGSSFYDTPNLDALAASGTRFTQAYASCPVCSPTRASIMTGKHPARVNITDWIPGQDPKNRKLLGPQDLDHLPLEETTIAEALKSKGYKTFFAGKWHLGDEGFFPEDQGFDINKGGHHRGSPPGGYYVPYENPKLDDGPDGEYLTDRLTDELIAFVRNNREDPFLLFLSFYTVHTPIQPCKRHLTEYEQKADALPGGPPDRPEHDGLTKMRQDNPEYATMVRAMDENVGRLMDELNRQGLADNTVVIFTSDNGGLSTLFNRGFPTCNLPLRAGKGWCYEGGVRVPLIVRAPGVTTPGTVSDEPVTSMDYFPTMLELGGFAPMPQQHRDGLSLAPVLREPDARLDRDVLFWHYPHYHGSAWTPGASIRAREWKLIEFYDKEKVELYNLRDDPGEQSDLSKAMPAKRDELLARLRELQAETGAKMPVPNPDFARQ